MSRDPILETPRHLDGGVTRRELLAGAAALAGAALAPRALAQSASPPTKGPKVFLD